MGSFSLSPPLKTFSGVLALVFLLLLPIRGDAAMMPLDSLLKASRLAREDSVGRGWCGRGVYSVLSGLDLPVHRSANGQDWEDVLAEAGWVPLHCPTPTMAPLGSALVYSSDVRRFGSNKVGTAGGRFGHVELVALEKGGRVYVSDTPRKTPGGSVPHNFTGRAWVPPGFVFAVGELCLSRSSFDAVAQRKASDALLKERLAASALVFALPGIAGL